jgi:hypothetical protein
MAKRSRINRNHKLRMKQKKQSRRKPKPKAREPLTLDEKVSVISSLAINVIESPGQPEFAILGANDFIAAIRLRTSRKEISVISLGHSNSLEAVLGIYGGWAKALEAHRSINNWLEKIGKPELKLSPEEFFDMILS